MKKGVIIITGLALIAAGLADDTPPVSIHLELAKDTLALAELVYLTATVSNNMNRDLLLDNLYMFHLEQEPYRFSLFLITSEEKVWPYVGSRGSISITYQLSPEHWLKVPSEKSVTKGMMVAWTDYVPSEYRKALEKIPSGSYRLFATYELPSQKTSNKVTIYSDTVEFVFLPLRWEHKQALIEMDSLYLLYMVGDARYKITPGLQRIMESRTPYSEAAHALFVISTGASTVNPDSLAAEKSHFDALYPESQFQYSLLRRQHFFLSNRGRVIKADSVDKILSRLEPYDSDGLLRKGVISHPATLDELR